MPWQSSFERTLGQLVAGTAAAAAVGSLLFMYELGVVMVVAVGHAGGLGDTVGWTMTSV